MNGATGRNGSLRSFLLGERLANGFVNRVVTTHRPFRHEDRNEVDVSVFVTFELISDVSVA